MYKVPHEGPEFWHWENLKMILLWFEADCSSPALLQAQCCSSLVLRDPPRHTHTHTHIHAHEWHV